MVKKYIGGLLLTLTVAASAPAAASAQFAWPYATHDPRPTTATTPGWSGCIAGPVGSCYSVPYGTFSGQGNVERQTVQDAYALWLGEPEPNGYYISRSGSTKTVSLGGGNWDVYVNIWDPEPQTLGRWCEYHYGASGNEVINFRTYLGKSCAWVSRTLIPYPESNG